MIHEVLGWLSYVLFRSKTYLARLHTHEMGAKTTDGQ